MKTTIKKEYTRPFTSKIFLFTCASIAILAGVFCILFLTKTNYTLSEQLAGSVVSFILVAFGLLALVDIFMPTKITIDDNTIRLKSTYTNKVLKFDEIKGYYVDKNNLYIYPNTKQKKKLVINAFIYQCEDFMNWLSENYDRIDYSET